VLEMEQTNNQMPMAEAEMIEEITSANADIFK
jgi:hypothetical protein